MQITPTLEISDDELEFRFSRSSGPGGQNVNRRATKAELTFDVAHSPSLTERQRSRIMVRLSSRIDAVGCIHVVAQAGRTQTENRRRAIERFATLLRAAVAPPPPPRKRTAPTKGAVDRRIKEKRKRSETKRARSRPTADD